MPHIIVDYSDNLAEESLQPQQLLKSLADTAVETGLFPRSGIRARAIRCDHALVADGSSDAAFVNVSMRVGAGRELAARQSAGEAIFQALKKHMAQLMKTRIVLLSFEMRELDTVKFNFKNI